MTHQEMWSCYCQSAAIPEETPHESWAFGCDADGLAALVLNGTKTATASGYALYALDSDEAMPKAGDYSVILDSREEAVCVIRTTKVFVVPFRDVDARQAWKEGEGDRSLAYWRQVHWDFFTSDYAEYGLKFTEDSEILCEEFDLLWKEGSI